MVITVPSPDSREWQQVYPAKPGGKTPLTHERLVVYASGEQMVMDADDAEELRNTSACSGIFAPVSHF